MSEKAPAGRRVGSSPPGGGLRGLVLRWWRGKVTPLHDLSWYVKWTAVVFILTAVAIRTLAPLPLVDFLLSLVGAFLWVTVGFMWRDRSIIAMNFVIAIFLLFGLYRVVGW